MIIVRLMGGLGNQMFQYAAGYHLASIHKTELKLDTSYFELTGDHTPRHYELNVFGIENQFASRTEIEKYRATASNRYLRFIQRKFPKLFSKSYVAESGRKFNPDFIKYPTNTYLEGFWQSEKYFLPVKNDIRKQFSFKKPLNGNNATLAEKIGNTESVGIHVRRGDYVNRPSSNQYHGVCSAEYYSDAIKLIAQKKKDIHLFICSDDMAWVKENLKFDFPTEYISGNIGDNSYIDMQLLSMCKHNVIANSSFSWWAGCLNNNQGGMVIAPKNWFAGTANDWLDIYAGGWIIL